MNLHVDVYEIPDEEIAIKEVAEHVISVYGADSPGIVYRTTALLAEYDANITNLDTRIVSTEKHPVYIMIIETAGGDWDKLPVQLEELAKSLGVDISARAIDAESL
jgi:glycine cleavage system transcriptional repressor